MSADLRAGIEALRAQSDRTGSEWSRPIYAIDAEALDAILAAHPVQAHDREVGEARIRLVVEVNLDPVPGWGNDPEDYRALTQRLLDDAIGHYKPTVTIAAGMLT